MFALLLLAVIVLVFVIVEAIGKSPGPRPNSTSTKARRTANRIFYRTKDGLTDYWFQFEPDSSGNYRAYILDMPAYGSRDTSLGVTHRLANDGRYYICWSRPLRSEPEARTIAALWADLTQVYIRTGRTIDKQMRENR